MTSLSPSIGIAIPIGDWSPLFARSLTSIRHQQNADISIAVLDASGDRRVRDDIENSGLSFAYEREGPDGGQTAAISEGWNNLDSDIVAWLNTDDLLIDGVLEEVVRVFRDNPDIDVYYGHSTISDKDGRILGLHPEVGPPSKLLYRSNIISQPSCFVRRKAVEDIGGLNNSLDYTMDWDLWVRLYKAGKNFAHTNRVFSNVTWGFDTKTSKFNVKRVRELARIVNSNSGLYSMSKSIFGFFLHYMRTYVRLGGKEHVKPKYRTPLEGKLNIPVLNLTDAPASQMTLRLAGHDSDNVLVKYLDQTVVAKDEETVLTLSAPIAPGRHVDIELECPVNSKASLDSIYWM